MSIQAPPNLSPGVLPQIVAAGIDDWGGVSPLTPDFVNPEAPWPHLDELARETAAAGKELHERLTIYPRFARDAETWVDAALRPALLDKIDGEGLPRTDHWCPGDELAPPAEARARITAPPSRVSPDVATVLCAVDTGRDLSEAEIVRLIRARGDDFNAVAQAADALRRNVNGDTVSYVVNRNINYTNICYFKCQFCAFSKGKLAENLRGRPYDLSAEEIQAPHRGGVAAGRHGSVQCRAASTRNTPAPPTSTFSRRSRKPCRRCTSTPSRRWKCGRVQRHRISRSTNTCANSSGPASAPCPARPPRSWTTKCAP